MLIYILIERLFFKSDNKAGAEVKWTSSLIPDETFNHVQEPHLITAEGLSVVN